MLLVQPIWMEYVPVGRNKEWKSALSLFDIMTHIVLDTFLSKLLWHWMIFRQNAERRFCLMSWPASTVVRSFVPHPSPGDPLEYMKDGLTFDLESPNLTRPSTASYCTATPDMTSPATSSRHWLKFEKTAKNVAFDGLGSNFSNVSFCPAQPIGELLVLLYRGANDF